MTDEKVEDNVLDFISEDKVFAFLTKYKKLEAEFKAMKKVYDERVKKPLKKIAGKDPMKVANDIFQVQITKSSITESILPVDKIKHLEQEIQDAVLREETVVIEKTIPMGDIRNLPQEWQDKLIVEKRTTPRMILKFVEDETDEDW